MKDYILLFLTEKLLYIIVSRIDKIDERKLMIFEATLLHAQKKLENKVYPDMYKPLTKEQIEELKDALKTWK